MTRIVMVWLGLMVLVTNVQAAFSTPKILHPSGEFYYHQILPNQTVPSKTSKDDLAVFILGGGPGFSSWNLEPIQQKIADMGHTVYLMDMLGIGENQAKKTDPVLDAWITQISQLKQSESADKPVILVSHSWGALMAMLYTRANPDDVERIILLNPVDPQKKAMENLTAEIHERNTQETDAKWDDESAWEHTTEFNEADLQTVTLRQIQQVLPTYFLDYEQGQNYAAQFTIQDFNIDLNIQAWKEYDAKPVLFSEINAWKKPLHFIECKQDYLMPYNLNAMQPNIQLASVDVIDQCGHFPWIEQPKIFYSTLEQYLK
ncbi:MAG: alpha/beta hydrolase [Thiotrichales bacterium]|nr:alpha/beta hydrolase [Thiotrichales bacterium]